MGNPVGSLEVPKILSARKRLRLVLSETQRELLIGTILGDAYITLLGKIRIEHSVKQREYVSWKYKQLKNIAYQAQPKEIVHKNRKGNAYPALYFLLRQYFRPWRAIFYKERQKIFPKGLLLQPLSLAVWYMDDGCWTGTKCVISTESFKGEYAEHMQQSLYMQYGIETVVGKNGKMVIRKKSHETFFRLIEPYIIPCMRYKLP